MNLHMLPLRNQRRSLAQAVSVNPKQDLTNLSIDQLMQVEITPTQKIQDKMSSLWWTANWPLVATAVGALGVMGYLIFKKKESKG